MQAVRGTQRITDQNPEEKYQSLVSVPLVRAGLPVSLQHAVVLMAARAPEAGRRVAWEALRGEAQQVEAAPDGGAEGIGRLNQAIGAAFKLPIGAVSAPIRTYDAIFVERVDQRVMQDRAEWEKTKESQRAQATNQLRQQKVRDFLQNLRETAKVVDRRKEIESANRVGQ